MGCICKYLSSWSWWLIGLLRWMELRVFSGMGFMCSSAAPCELAHSSSFLLPTLAQSSAMIKLAKSLASQTLLGCTWAQSKHTLCLNSCCQLDHPYQELHLEPNQASTVIMCTFWCILATPPRLDFSDKGTSSPCKPGNKTSYHLQRWLIQRKAKMDAGSQSTLMNAIICKNPIHLEFWKLNLCD